MHIIVANMEEIDDDRDLLEELDAICSSINLEPPSPTIKEHKLQQQHEALPVIPSKLHLTSKKQML